MRYSAPNEFASTETARRSSSSIRQCSTNPDRFSSFLVDSPNLSKRSAVSLHANISVLPASEKVWNEALGSESPIW